MSLLGLQHDIMLGRYAFRCPARSFAVDSWSLRRHARARRRLTSLYSIEHNKRSHVHPIIATGEKRREKIVQVGEVCNLNVHNIVRITSYGVTAHHTQLTSNVVRELAALMLGLTDDAEMHEGTHRDPKQLRVDDRPVALDGSTTFETKTTPVALRGGKPDTLCKGLARHVTFDANRQQQGPIKLSINETLQKGILNDQNRSFNAVFYDTYAKT